MRSTLCWTLGVVVSAISCACTSAATPEPREAAQSLPKNVLRLDGMEGTPGARGADGRSGDIHMDALWLRTSTGSRGQSAADGAPGAHGARGADAPKLTVLVTRVRTPDGPRTLLQVREQERYALFPPNEPVLIVASGGRGGPGGRGGAGGNGALGGSGRLGGEGGNGGNGGNGGDGGGGGNGGDVTLWIDEAYPELSALVHVDTSGGRGGPGGLAGTFGAGGQAGSQRAVNALSLVTGCQVSTDCPKPSLAAPTEVLGEDLRRGNEGHVGARGRPGADGLPGQARRQLRKVASELRLPPALSIANAVP